MNMCAFFRKNTNGVLVFLLIAVVISIIQFVILKPVYEYRLFNKTEDWPFLVLYYSYSDPLMRIKDIWTGSGLHTTSEIYHTGLVAKAAGYNYQNFHIINSVFKVISVLSFFPLVFLLFRNKLLAYLSTIIYSLNAAPSGSFLWIGKGSVYIATAFLNIFLISYYYTVTKHTKKLLLISALLFSLTYLLSPSRLFPMLLLVLLIEIFWLISKGMKSNIKFSIMRLALYFIPVILISKSAPVSACCPFTKQPFMLLESILSGNLDEMLYPFAALGYTLVTNDYWRFLGNLNFQTFQDFGSYIGFILFGSFITFGILTAILSLILSEKPSRFFLKAFSLNLILEILMFFIARHNEPYDLVKFMVTKYPVLVALYIFSISFVSFREWRGQKTKNKLLMAVWAGPLFAAIFIWPTWMIIGKGLISMYSSVNWYLVIPPMGTALFIAGILTLLYEKLRKKVGSFIAVFFIFAFLGTYYLSNSNEIKRTFTALNPAGVKVFDQQKLHDKLMDKLGNHISGNLFMYLDLNNEKNNPKYYLESLVLSNDEYGNDDIGDWIQLRRFKSDGCIQAVVDKEVLKKLVVFDNNQKGFIYKGVCLEHNAKPVYSKKDKVFYGLKDFEAFRLKNGEFIDIKEETLKELNLNLLIAP